MADNAVVVVGGGGGGSSSSAADTAVTATDDASGFRPQINTEAATMTTTTRTTAAAAAAEKEDVHKQLNFRAPSSPAFDPPPSNFLAGRWHVTHSTLPMWKTKKNVAITYTFLDSTGSIDDLVTYHPLDAKNKDNDKYKDKDEGTNTNKHKPKTVRGIDTPDPTIPGAYNWRGKGWLKIASSHWQVLGWGQEEGGWVVTFFAKTLFTPAGIDIYARRQGGLSAALVDRLKAQMSGGGDGDGDGVKNGVNEAFEGLQAQIFEVVHEWRED